MNTYRVDASEILSDLGASIDIVDEIDLGDVSLGELVFASRGPAHVEAQVTNTGAGLVSSGTVSADFDSECSRCLKPFVLHVEGQIEGFYTTPELAEEVPDDQEWEEIHDGTIDLIGALHAAVVMELPFAPLHDPDCPGICPSCGVDLNEETCECGSEPDPDSPFAALQGLIDASGSSL